MRTRMTLVLGLVAASAMATFGCGTRGDNCQLNLDCGQGGASASSSSTTTTSGGGGTGGTPINCVPSDGKDPVAESCGVFVSSSFGVDDQAKDRGGKAKPFKSIGAALMKVDVARVYVCAESFSEAVVVSSAVELYGAVDCLKSWAYDPSKKTTLTAAEDQIPLTLGNAAGAATVEDFAISAAAAKAPGGSSIAVLANGATASLTRCDLTSADASGGGLGVDGGPQETPAQGGIKGDDAGAMSTFAGGGGGKNMICSLQAGKGGDGGVLSGDGIDGTQGDGNMGGAKGTGDTGAGCTPGGQGGNGGKGMSGAGAMGTGTLSAKGYQGADGDVGQDGGNGKSGGGGGGSKASATVHGAGGGGGGAGGCGGKHGTGGTAGGSSIALASVGAKVTLAECKLSTGKGGAGGKGGDGQFGQPGGDPAFGGKGSMSVVAGCAGGAGGSGANGGNGGGGLGGHALGIAVTGSAPILDTATQKAITPGAKGTGGPGGNTSADANQGADGITVACWDFSKGKACFP